MQTSGGAAINPREGTSGAGTAPADRRAPHSSPLTDAEGRILDAATEVFGRRGFYGARTQAIAEVAGVNKAMVHYYFRSKENLYVEVLAGPLREFGFHLRRVVEPEYSLPEFLDALVDTFMDFFTAHPSFTRILLREAAGEGERLHRAVERAKLGITETAGAIIAEVKEKFHANSDMSDADIYQLYVSINGMCLMSMITPKATSAFWEYDLSDFADFLDRRRVAIKQMVRAYFDCCIAQPPSLRADGG